MGIKCSRWVTMHGFALNVNTDLSYFDHIVPCGIRDKKVTSLADLLGKYIDHGIVKEKIMKHFEEVFSAKLKRPHAQPEEAVQNSYLQASNEQ